MDDPVDLAFADFLDAALRGEEPDLDRVIAAHPQLSEEQRRRLRELAGVVDGTAGGDAAAPPFERLGDFKLIRRLGEGGMGVVYLAEQVSLRRAVALKLVRPERVGSPTVAARFEREALAVAKLRHPNVVTVLATGEERGVRYLAMELVPGKGLNEILAEEHAAGRAAAIPTAVRWARDLARALAAAHEQGVVHRDVKPSNVRITPDGRAMLVDFGLARIESAESLSLTGAFQGSPYYASPEQVSQTAEGVDARTDVYSLGVTLYECLGARVPFSGDTTEQVFHEILTREPEGLRRLRPEISRDVEAVVATAMEKDRARRYPSAAALADDLDALLELRPISARAISPLGRAWRWTRRNRAKASAIAMGTLLVVVAPSVIAWRESRAKSELAAETTKTEEALKDSVAARGELQGKLDEVRRLSDIQKVRDAMVQSTKLGPALPERLDRFDRLLRVGTELFDRLPKHEETLARWKTLAPGTPEAPSAWELSVLEDLVGQLKRLGPRLDEVRATREFAATIEEKSVRAPEAADAWAHAIEAIAADPRFEGLRLAPQVGLVPLEPDPVSGLWEFLHLQSGAAPARDAATGRYTIEPASGMVLVLVPGGVTHMGAVRPTASRPAGQPFVDPDAAPPETPVIELTLRPFFLSKYEMTQAQWERATGKRPSLYRPGNQGLSMSNPVESISWDDAVPVLDGLDLVLPTEAQWEHACRAGTTTVYSTGDAPVSLQGFANVADAFFRRNTSLTTLPVMEEIDDGFQFHAPVGSFQPNAFGMHDMHGNVREWCADSDKSSPNETHVAERRAGDGLYFAERAAVRINRGGSYKGAAKYQRVAIRNFSRPSSTNDELGVRPARAIR